MAKVKNPVWFSDYFKLEPAQLGRAGVLNPTLNVNTKLFMDPLLMESSGMPMTQEHQEASFSFCKSYVIMDVRYYSFRKTMAGSMRAARKAGMSTAVMAEIVRTATAAA